MVQIWGSYQRFEYAELSLQLNLSDYCFRPTDGDNNLDRIGYDRYLEPEFEPNMFLGYAGASHVEGPAHPAPHKFMWELQWLTPEKYDLLIAIIRRSRADKAPVRLIDNLLVLEEPAPRTRAKVGPYLELRHGLAWFFPIFQVWLELPEGRQTRINGRHYLTLSGREWNPRDRLDLTEDLAA